MKLLERHGDLIKLAIAGEFDVIVHGCNCLCAMGSGIAAQIRSEIPQAYDADHATILGDYNKLGTYTWAPASGDGDHMFVVINAYTQYGIRRSASQPGVFEYTAFDLILQKLNHAYPSARIGFPAIGMERAGGDRERILKSLHHFANSRTAETTIVWYNGTNA